MFIVLHKFPLKQISKISRLYALIIYNLNRFENFDKSTPIMYNLNGFENVYESIPYVDFALSALNFWKLNQHLGDIIACWAGVLNIATGPTVATLKINSLKKL